MQKRLLSLGATALIACDEQSQSDIEAALRVETSGPNELIQQTGQEVDDLLFVLPEGTGDTVLFVEDLPVIDLEAPGNINLPDGIDSNSAAIWPTGLVSTDDIAAVNYQHGTLIHRNTQQPVASYDFNLPDPNALGFGFDVEVAWLDRSANQPPVDVSGLQQLRFTLHGTHFDPKECPATIDPIDFEYGQDGAVSIRLECGTTVLDQPTGFAPGTATLTTYAPFDSKFGLSGLHFTFRPDISIADGQNYTTGTETRGVVSSGGTVELHLPARVEIDGGPIPEATSFGTNVAAISSPAIIARTQADTATLEYDAELAVFNLDEEGTPNWFTAEQIDDAISKWSLVGARDFHNPSDTLNTSREIASEAFTMEHLVNPWGTGPVPYIMDRIDSLSPECQRTYPSMSAADCDQVATHLGQNQLRFYADINTDFDPFSNPENPLFNTIGISSRILHIVSNAEGIQLHQADGQIVDLPYTTTYTGERVYLTTDTPGFFSEDMSLGGFVAFSDEYVCIWAYPGDPELCTSDVPEGDCDAAVYTFYITQEADCPQTWEEAVERANAGQ